MSIKSWKWAVGSAVLTPGVVLATSAIFTAGGLAQPNIANAAQWQFVITTGSPCEGCCFTGYCCDVPASCGDDTRLK